MVLLADCVIPPSLEEEPAENNHQPRILRDTSPVPETEVTILVKQPGAPDDDPKRESQDVLQLLMRIEDRDLDDLLTVRVFLDYDAAAPTGPTLSGVAASTNDALVRLYSGTIPGICGSVGNAPEVLAVVSDGNFNDAVDGGFPFRSPAGAGETDQTFWTIRCDPAPKEEQ
ncbi:MAG: hypothetical protein AABZ30_13415 [Myxococcota bacterium]